ncbi:MAG TPA: tetratricopeptide repeat protein, partial [candidate division Zixibacteria bacterium]|nr:tetratricopeptide repeat protein [candidate division Zixibacteria bacterium]
MKITSVIILILLLTTCLFGDYARNLELAQRYIALDKYDDARVILEKLAEEKPDDARAQNMLKQVYRATKDSKALLAIIEKELAQNPKDPEIWADAGQLYLSQGEAKKAIEAYDKALKLDPQNYGLVMKVFLAYRAWGYYDEAISVLTTARKGSDDPALFAMEIASLHEIGGDWESAADEYGRYLNKYPDRFREVEDRMNEVSADTTQLAALEKAVEKLQEAGVQGDRIDRLQSRLQIRQNKYMDAAKS